MRPRKQMIHRIWGRWRVMLRNEKLVAHKTLSTYITDSQERSKNIIEDSRCTLMLHTACTPGDALHDIASHLSLCRLLYMSSALWIWEFPQCSYKLRTPTKAENRPQGARTTLRALDRYVAGQLRCSTMRCSSLKCFTFDIEHAASTSLSAPTLSICVWTFAERNHSYIWLSSACWTKAESLQKNTSPSVNLRNLSIYGHHLLWYGCNLSMVYNLHSVSRCFRIGTRLTVRFENEPFDFI